MSTHIDPRTKKILISEGGDTRSAPDSKQPSPAMTAQAEERFAPIWRNWHFGAVAAASGTAVWALLAGWWMPRGPLTSGQALVSLAISLVVGASAGLVTRDRFGQDDIYVAGQS